MSEHLDRLMAMVAPGQQTWDLSDNDVAAIRWALAELARRPPSLKWTSEPPKVPGRYLYWASGDRLLHQNVFDESDIKREFGKGWKWLGPIPEPRGPEGGVG